MSETRKFDIPISPLRRVVWTFIAGLAIALAPGQLAAQDQGGTGGDFGGGDFGAGDATGGGGETGVPVAGEGA